MPAAKASATSARASAVAVTGGKGPDYYETVIDKFFQDPEKRPQTRAELSPNKDYWDKARVPKLDKMVLLPTPETATRTAALRALPDARGSEFANGHDRATGGSLELDEFERLLAGLSRL